jgi:hypothetical protein
MSTSIVVVLLVKSALHLYNQIRNHPTIQTFIDIDIEQGTFPTSLVLLCALIAFSIFIWKWARGESMRRRIPDTEPPEEHIESVSQYPPGMQVDSMLEKWKKDGMDPTMSRLRARRPG